MAAAIGGIDGRPADCDPALLAAHCLAMFQDWYVKRWKYRAAKIGPDQFADSVVGFARRYLGGAAAAQPTF